MCTRKHLTDRTDGASPVERFSGMPVSLSLKKMHDFSCPVHALDSNMHANKSITRLNQRSRIVLNIGSLPMHARNVNLILNLQTGTVSPQFHVQHDDF